MTIYLIDSALSQFSGHHDHFVRGWRDSSKLVETNTVVLGPQNASAEVVRAFQMMPVLTRSLYEAAEDPGNPFEDFHIGSVTLADDLEASNIDPTEADLILLPTATPRELAGLCKWMSKLEGKRPAIAAIFHWGNEDGLRAGTIHAELLRTVAKLIAMAQPRRCWVGATHASLSRGLAGVLQQPVEIVPSMTFFPREGFMRPAASGDRLPLLAFLGGARAAKGTGMLPALLQLATDQKLPARFVVQCHGMTNAGFELQRFRSDSILLLEDWLPTEAFNSLLVSVAALVLPYDPRFYGAMVSGVFTMSAALGKPSIVPSGTWMSERIAHGEAAGVVYSSEDGATGVLTAVKEFLCDAEALKARAVALSHAWRRSYSADRLVETIAGLGLPQHNGGCQLTPNIKTF